MLKLTIIIPVYNEERTIAEVLKKVTKVKLKNITKEIIIVNDSSTDNTKTVIENYKNQINFKLLHNKRNSGKGFSVRRGLKIATGDIILIQDADLEYEINEYPEVLEPILKKKTQFVLGSRHLNTKPWKTHSFLDSKIYARVLNAGAVFYSKLVNLVLGTNLTDPGTMYKVFTKDCLEGVNLKSNHFDIDWEIVTKFVKKGIVPIEVPITYKSRSPKEGKKIKLFRDGILIFWAIIRYKFVD